MALGFMQLAKLMKGDLGPDEIAEVLGSMGVEADCALLQPGQVPVAFQTVWQGSQEAGAKVVRIQLSKEGSRVSGLLVFEVDTPLPAAKLPAPKGGKLLPDAV